MDRAPIHLSLRTRIPRLERPLALTIYRTENAAFTSTTLELPGWSSVGQLVW